MQENQQNQTKSRSSALTTEAIKRVDDRLSKALLAQNMSAKLTLRSKAEYLAYDEKTIRRVLSGEKVDRNTLEGVFRRLGITLNDNFLILEVPESQSKTNSSRNTKRHLWFGICAGGALLTAVVPLITFGANAKAQPSQWREEFFTGLNRGTTYYQNAQYGQARREFSAILAIATKEKDIACQAESIRMNADVDMAQGRFQLGRDGYAKALALREQTGQSSTYPALQQALGVAETKLEDFPAAKAWLRKALDGYVAQNDGDGTAIVQRDLGSLCSAQGDLDGALSWFASARSGSERSVKTALLMDVRAQEAMVYQKLGQSKRAEQDLTDCLAYWKQEGHARWIASTEFQLATVKLATRDYVDAKRLLTQADRSFRALGDTHGQAKVQQTLRICKEVDGSSAD